MILTLVMALWACAEESEKAARQSPEPPETVPTLSEAERTQYREQGRRIAQATFGVLSSNLMQAAQAGGVANAVNYCQVAAYPLTDSMAQAMQASVRRTALRYRNPANAPSATERRVLEQYEAQMARSQAPKARVQPWGADSVAFFAPIILMEACSKCHGTPGEDIAAEDYALIQEKYPEDRAIGFAVGDLRGMWSIRFAREEPR